MCKKGFIYEIVSIFASILFGGGIALIGLCVLTVIVRIIAWWV